jgi:hypothetical protein
MSTMSMSSYSGFSNGVMIRGVPIVQTHPGRVFWVYNGTVLGNITGIANGSDGNDGTFRRPYATLNYAVTQASAGRGDVIVIKPGHAETVATAGAISLGVAGIAIIGLGYGANRPTFSWSTAASTILVAANDIVVQNLLCLGTMATTFTVTAFSNANTVVANDFTIDNCEFRDNDATHGFIACYTGGTTANQSDGLTFTNNKVFRQLTSPPAANTAVVFGAAVNRVTFNDNIIINKTVNNNVALGVAFGANAVQNLQMARNRTYSLNTTSTAGELMSGGSTTSSGMLWDNYVWSLSAAGGAGLLAPVSTKLGFSQNFASITGAADKQPLLNPLAV